MCFSYTAILLIDGSTYVLIFFFFLMIRRPPRSTLDRSSAASDVYKRQDVQSRDAPGDRPGRDGERLRIEAVEEGRSGSGADEENGPPGPCLLYTSPSPRDRTRSRMPSSA